MGNCCCHTESPCGSAEERCVLLKNDSKATVPAGETNVEGTCGPDGDDDIRKTHNEAEIKVEVKSEPVQVKHSPEKRESEPNNTQENGPTKKESVQAATPSPVCQGSRPEENSTRAQDKDSKEPPDGGEGTDLLKCTLVSEQKDQAAAEWEVFTETNEVPEVETPDSVPNKPPGGVLLTAELLEAEKPPPVETTISTGSTPHHHEEEASAEPLVDKPVNELSGGISQKEEVSPVPEVQLAAEAERVPSVSVVGEEKDTEEVSCVVTEDPGDGASSAPQQPGPEEITSHDVCESSPGAASAGRNHSAEERDSANCVRESEAAPPADGSSESSKSDQRAKPDPESTATSLKVEPLLENNKHDAEEETMVKEQDKEEDVPKVKDDDEVMEEEEEEEEEEEKVMENVPSESGKDAEIQEVKVEGEEPTGSSSAHVKVEAVTVAEKEDVGTSDEDLYRGAEELSESQHNKPGAPGSFESTLLKVEDRCSLAPAVDVLTYSEREWRGNTAKSALIRKGYREMSQTFSSLRRVRGDNYCALRATLYQVLSHSTQLPAWLQDHHAAMLPEQLEAQEGLISQWLFPGACLQGDGTGDVTQQLKNYMELLRNKWRAAVDCSSAAERLQLCERVFQGGEEELGLLEALKLLMLGRAVELHGRMQAGGDVPLFCWLLFARDSSDCPRSFLSNHLSHMGLSAGLEQVEMFLLGYALHCTIQVYRLYKADTEEFVTYYPDDHKDDWPSVCLVTEDDRHYNVPVVEAAEPHDELDSS